MRKFIAAAAAAAAVGLSFSLASPATANQTPAFSKPVPAVSLLKVTHQLPPAKGQKRPLTGCTVNCHTYAGFQQTAPPATLSGIYDGKDMSKPTLGTGDVFSLYETAALDSLTPSSANTVEIGAVVSPSLFGDSNLHLFVSYWINGVFQGWNPSGFTKCTKVAPFNCGAAAIAWPGDNLNSVVTTPPTLMRFGIEHTGSGPTGAWFVDYGTSYVGYFADSLWPAGTNFNLIKFFENFGEIQSSGASACGQMADGTYATSSTGMRDATLTYNIATPVPTYSGSVITDPTNYTAVYSGASTRTFRYGGDNPSC